MIRIDQCKLASAIKPDTKYIVVLIMNESIEYFTINLMPISYLIQRPRHNVQIRRPLLVYLHGFGENHNISKVRAGPPGLTTIHPILQTSIILSPICPKYMWWRCKDLMQLIDHIVEHENVDIKRIYLMGISMGGFAIWALLSQYPNRFAAAIPICAGVNPISVLLACFRTKWKEFNRFRFSQNKYTAVWAFHGDIDFVVPMSESVNNIQRLKDNGNKHCKLTILHGVGHKAWPYVFHKNEVFTWLFSKQLYWVNY